MSIFLFALVFLAALMLAGALPPALSENALKIQGQLTLLGLFLLLGFPFYRSAVLLPFLSKDRKPLEANADRDADAVSVAKPLSRSQYLVRLFSLQIALFYISLIFFYTMDSMTRWNARLQPLKEGQLFEILQNEFLQVCYLPWILYTVMGVGLAYFTTCEGRYPSFPKLIIPKPEGKLQWVLHNYLHIVVDAVMSGPFIWLLPLAMIWLCESLNSIFGQCSLFTYPIRSIFILGILCLYFNRSHHRLLDQMDRLKIPLGTMLVIYVIMGSLLFFLLHAITQWFMTSLGNPETKIVKSLIAQSLSEDMQGRRLSILIWSWWMLWIPWMASQIARLSLGRKVWVACLCSLIVPSVLFIFWYKGVGIWHWEILQQLFAYTLTKFLCALGILFFLFFFFRDVYSVQDFTVGGMLVYGKQKRNHSLKKWMHGLVILMSGHMIALFMMGWLSVQILSTLGGLVMLTVLLGFILALLSSRDFLSALRKHKVLGKLGN